MPWGLRHANLFKKRFGISVFLRTFLRNIKEHLFYRTPLGEYFCLMLCEIEHIFPLTLVDDAVLWLNFYGWMIFFISTNFFNFFYWIFFQYADLVKFIVETLKGTLLGLKRFLATESALKMMKNAFYFTSKALFVLKIFKILSWHFGHAAKRLAKKVKISFKFYDVTAWFINNCNTHVVQYLEK